MKYTLKVNVNSNQRRNLKYFVFVLFVIPRSQALFSYKRLTFLQWVDKTLKIVYVPCLTSIKLIDIKVLQCNKKCQVYLVRVCLESCFSQYMCFALLIKYGCPKCCHLRVIYLCFFMKCVATNYFL